MSTWPAPSALDASTQAFPVLTAAQINRLRPDSKLRKVEPGEILFQPGDTEVPFFVLLSGSMEIVQPDLTGERPIATHGPGEFTGEITMISGQRCLVRGRVTEAGEFLEISADGLPARVNSLKSVPKACARWLPPIQNWVRSLCARLSCAAWR